MNLSYFGCTTHLELPNNKYPETKYYMLFLVGHYFSATHIEWPLWFSEPLWLHFYEQRCFDQIENELLTFCLISFLKTLTKLRHLSIQKSVHSY